MPGKSGKIRSGNIAALFPVVVLIPFETAKCFPLPEDAFTFSAFIHCSIPSTAAAHQILHSHLLLFFAFFNRIPRFTARRARSDKLIIVRFDHAIIDLTVLVRLASDVFLRILIRSDHIFRPAVQS